MLNNYVPDSLIPILICLPTYDTSIKFSLLFYENYRDLPQHKVLFDEYVVYTDVGYKLGSIEYRKVNGAEEWYKNRLTHRGGDHPAYISDTIQEWWKNGEYHRDNDLPARIWDDGTQGWYKNGTSHRENDKPAFIWADGEKLWFKNGKQIK